MVLSTAQLERLNLEFEAKTPPEILAWAWETFQPKIIATSSFQSQSVALLHLISQICPQLPVLFLDTGFHFPETLAFKDELAQSFNLNIKMAYPDPQLARSIENPVAPLYLKDPDLCCKVHKVEPMARSLTDLSAWITGVRRDQTAHRRGGQILTQMDNGAIKIAPILNWTRRDVWTYINQHNLPAHPLFSQGYMSIGCAPCTQPVFDGQDERAGRWTNNAKTECGLHTFSLNLDSNVNENLSETER